MKVVVVCEGRTERALKSAFRDVITRSIGHARVGIETRSMDGRLAKRKFTTVVRNLLQKEDVRAVVALTDVYPYYNDALSAKNALNGLVEDVPVSKEFRPHAAQFEVEAWLIPFWDEIASRLRVKAKRPGANPERVNTTKPPSQHIQDLYARAKKKYDKVIDGQRWLTADRLERASAECPELREFLDTLVELSSTAAP